MYLHELIDHLTELAERHDEPVLVRIANQPSYPIAARIVNVAFIERDDDEGLSSEERPPTVWLATDAVGYEEHPYAPAAAWDGE